MSSLFHNLLLGINRQFSRTGGTMARKVSKLGFYWLILCALMAGTCIAQEPSSPVPDSQEKTEADTAKKQESREPFSSPMPDSRQEPEGNTTQKRESQEPFSSPMPDARQEAEGDTAQKQESRETDTFGVQSIVDQVFHNEKTRAGFSLGAHQNFTSNVLAADRLGGSTNFPSFNARFFFNRPGRNSQFHFDAGAGYRMYKRSNQLYKNWDVTGNVQYSRQLSKRTSFAISDHIFTIHNDASSLESVYSTSYFNYGDPSSYYNYRFSTEFLLNLQQINRNDLAGSITFETSRKSHLGIFGDYQIYDFLSSEAGNADSISAGANFAYQLTEWLSLSSSYSTYLNNVDQKYSDSRAQTVRVGDLRFHLTPNWDLWAGGGVHFSGSGGQAANQVVGTVDAGIERYAENLSLGVRYQRGLTSIIGIPGLVNSDQVYANIRYALKRWMTLRFTSAYHRNKDISGGELRVFSNGGGMQIAFLKYLIASASYVYQSQKAQNFAVPGMGLNRSLVSLGLQFIWPASRRQPGDWINRRNVY
jgi:hypothetical protein